MAPLHPWVVGGVMGGGLEHCIRPILHRSRGQNYSSKGVAAPRQ